MKTKIFTDKQIKEAAELIKQAELVAFPTETVYGLGANAFDPIAVKKIFIAKGRPSDNPLIVHISDIEQLEKVTIVTSRNKPLVEKLVKAFWPGPLTVVLTKTHLIPLEVTAGLNTVAVRLPMNKIAQDLIKFSGVPIAAPSANLSGKPSGISFEHVYNDFNGRIAGIIKSKSSEIGLESTVVDLTGAYPLLLRPGAITFEQLRLILPNIKIYSGKKVKRPRSPGMKYRHYSTNAKIILFETSASHKIYDYEQNLRNNNKKVRIILSEKSSYFAKNLYNLFRNYDKENVDCILISSVDEQGIGLAIMNRIRRAASEVVR